jgi:hypothetical protein
MDLRSVDVDRRFLTAYCVSLALNVRSRLYGKSWRRRAELKSGCILLPETSCEEGNRLLDRAMLVGTIDNTKIGFFGDAPVAR